MLRRYVSLLGFRFHAETLVTAVTEDALTRPSERHPSYPENLTATPHGGLGLVVVLTAEAVRAPATVW